METSNSMSVETHLGLKDPESEAKRIEKFIRHSLSNADCETGIVGLSGGIDSAVTSLLALRSLGENGVVVSFMPEETTPKRDEEDVTVLENKFNLDVKRYGIDSIVETFLDLMPDINDLTLANIKARVRMVLLYALANKHGGMVIGTENLSELLLGYFTKYGDGAADVEPIAHLYKTELKDLAKSLGIPKSIIDKPPSAGLWADQTDEKELGGTYSEIDEILYCLHDLHLSRSEAKEELDLQESFIGHIYDLVDGSSHKRVLPYSLDR